MEHLPCLASYQRKITPSSEQQGQVKAMSRYNDLGDNVHPALSCTAHVLHRTALPRARPAQAPSHYEGYVAICAELLETTLLLHQTAWHPFGFVPANGLFPAIVRIGLEATVPDVHLLHPAPHHHALELPPPICWLPLQTC